MPRPWILSHYEFEALPPPHDPPPPGSVLVPVGPPVPVYPALLERQPLRFPLGHEVVITERCPREGRYYFDSQRRRHIPPPPPRPPAYPPFSSPSSTSHLNMPQSIPTWAANRNSPENRAKLDRLKIEAYELRRQIDIYATNTKRGVATNEALADLSRCQARLDEVRRMIAVLEGRG